MKDGMMKNKGQYTGKEWFYAGKNKEKMGKAEINSFG